jgi:hypothetical protein
LEIQSPKYGTFLVLIDEVDVARVSSHRWSLARPQDRGDIAYFTTSAKNAAGRDSSLSLHRFILGDKDGHVVDHVRPDQTLDNRRCNLRHVTRKGNQQNQRCHRDGTSQFKGVSWHSARRKWQAHITVDHKQRYLGTFPRHQEVEAARRYNEAAMEQNEKFGGHFLLNAL